MVAIPVGDVQGCWRQTKWWQDTGRVRGETSNISSEVSSTSSRNIYTKCSE